ncbi:SAM-dependent methyltransferase [Saccharopolyspora rosea]|uniref:SAM-dependent methyltransferase n=1 Tax=Saccharopolyspora rosea TaxID=524884 RepID=A0ABW3FN94_9PSEU
MRRTYHEHGETLRWRDRAQTERFFEGLDLLDPGIVQMHKWRPDSDAHLAVPDSDIAMYGAIARKP